MNDIQLLEDFVKNGSEAAFRSITERHLPLVLGTARRITGNELLVEEIAQAVFILLARKARSFGSATVLAGWLYRTTCFVAARALRAELRRKHREQEAVAMQTHNESEPSWKTVTPHLDEALQKLNRTDRDAVLLRYIEQLPVRDVASNLGLGEEAAKKRVSRALEKLRRILSRRSAQIGAAALIAGLAHEGAQAATTSAVVLKISAAALAPSATSPLTIQVLSAWRAAKLKLGLGIGSGAIAVALLTAQVARVEHKEHSSSQNQAAAAGQAKPPPSVASASSNRLSPTTMEFAGQTFPIHPLQITVLDKHTSKPVPGANITHSLMWSSDNTHPVPLHTDTNGVVTFPVPESLPGDDRMSQFQVFVTADNYAPRDIMWLCSTGHVLGLVTNNYTIHIEPGITISGTVTGEDGQPISRTRIGASGSNYRGYSWSSDDTGKVTSPPVLRVEDFSSFNSSAEDPNARVTDRNGRFEIAHFPTDLMGLIVEIIGEDGSRQRFRTPQGDRLTSDDLPQIPYHDLQNGTAKLVLPRGATVTGMVVDDKGEPVIGATVSEGTQWGNLKILSRTDTDYEGRFWFSNRPPREYIFAATANHHASASTIVAVNPSMGSVRIQLPPEQPLRCRVVNESGQPLPDTSVRLSDLNNEGLGLEWDGKTDADGRFVWRGAPTNEVALLFSTISGIQRLVRLTATTNEQAVVLRDTSSPLGTVFVNGTVVDKTTGQPVDRFTVKLCHDRTDNLPRSTQTVVGTHGEFKFQTSQSEVAVGNYPYWCLLIEASGYEPLATRNYEYYEGDQQLALQLSPGGTIEGIVHMPDGEPAVGAQCAAASTGNSVISSQSGNLQLPRDNNGLFKTDAQGHFKVSKPLNARSLVIFHKSGWSIGAIPEDSQQQEIQLRPWGCVEGTVKKGDSPVPNESVGIHFLSYDNPDNSVCVLRSATTDAEGHFILDSLPAGEYLVALEPRALQRVGMEVIKSLETPVRVAAGETNHIELGDAAGRTVLAKIQSPSLGLDWNDCRAVLKRDVSQPQPPSRGNFINDTSYSQARVTYAHDPAVLNALRQERTYLGNITTEGVASFEDVPPGNYVLEVKALSKDKSGQFAEFKITASLRENIIVMPETDAASTPVVIGPFTLETL